MILIQHKLKLSKCIATIRLYTLVGSQDSFWFHIAFRFGLNQIRMIFVNRFEMKHAVLKNDSVTDHGAEGDKERVHQSYFERNREKWFGHLNVRGQVLLLFELRLFEQLINELADSFARIVRRTTSKWCPMQPKSNSAHVPSQQTNRVDGCTHYRSDTWLTLYFDERMRITCSPALLRRPIDRAFKKNACICLQTNGACVCVGAQDNRGRCMFFREMVAFGCRTIIIPLFHFRACQANFESNARPRNRSDRTTTRQAAPPLLLLNSNSTSKIHQTVHAPIVFEVCGFEEFLFSSLIAVNCCDWAALASSVYACLYVVWRILMHLHFDTWSAAPVQLSVVVHSCLLLQPVVSFHLSTLYQEQKPTKAE